MCTVRTLLIYNCFKLNFSLYYYYYFFIFITYKHIKQKYLFIFNRINIFLHKYTKKIHIRKADSNSNFESQGNIAVYKDMYLVEDI